MTKITAKTPLSEVYQRQLAIMKGKFAAIGQPDADPVILCPGMAFFKQAVDENADATVSDFIKLLHASDSQDVGDWIAMFLADQWDDIYPEYKDEMIPLIKGSQVVAVMKAAKFKIGERNLRILRENYRLFHDDDKELDNE